MDFESGVRKAGDMTGCIEVEVELSMLLAESTEVYCCMMSQAVQSNLLGCSFGSLMILPIGARRQ